MNIAREHKAINAALDTYRNRLDTIPDEQFDLTPPGGGWSYAEVYSHILLADIGSTIAMERCINGTCPPTKKGLNILGRLVLFFRRFPPIKVKVPAAIAAKQAVGKITKEEAKNLLIKCRRRIDDIASKVSSAPLQNRYGHPRFGMLNAPQWFKFILVHTKHHLKQLNRIENEFLKG
jgi:hypothetical protein